MRGSISRGKEAAIVSGRGVLSIGLEKKYGLRPSCLLYSRGGRGKESIPREGGLSPCSRGSEGKLSWTRRAVSRHVRYHTTDLCLPRLISRWAMLEFVRHSCSALTACTCLRAPGKNHLSMTRAE